MKQTDIDTQTLNEEFYQISPDILASFPKFRLPLNLYRFDEKISQLAPYYKKGNRLPQEQQREMAKISREGQLFVSREDHKIYAKHISKQLDLVLMDKHLTTGEIVYIIKYALTEKIDDFFEQPVDAALSKLFSDTKVVTEYIISELDNINHLLNQLHEDYSNAHLCYNSSILGLAVFLDAQGEEYKRKALDQLALGLFTHGLGLSRIPKFILEKKTNLTPDEQSKLTNYPMNGAGIMRKLDIMDEIVLNCHLEHKEMMDGSGIPRGMRGNELSLHGKIASVCHAFCELTLIRNDKSLPYNKALEFLTASQQKYDPKITKRLNKIVLKLMGRQQLNKS